MIAVKIIVCVALLFLIASIFLFNGKGKWLIAGYNTTSKEDKEKYDEKKICKVAGFICLICAIMLCIMAYMGYRVESGRMDENWMLLFGLVFAAVVLITVIAAIKYMNTNAKK